MTQITVEEFKMFIRLIRVCKELGIDTGGKNVDEIMLEVDRKIEMGGVEG